MIEGTVDGASLADEAIRVHRRYMIEVVEACGLCPWAERARLQGRTRHVACDSDRDDAPLDFALSALARWADDGAAEVGFLIFPRSRASRAAFDAFTARVRDADAARHPLGEIPFVLAAFHPNAEADTRDAETLIPYLRRSPDPCIQALRASVLDRVRAGSPQGTQLVDVAALEAAIRGAAPVPLRERIARTNLETVQRMGIEVLEARLADIRADRDRSYQRLVHRFTRIDARTRT